MAQGGSNKKTANSLVAMSSAAVLAVYAAGYTRTRTAAQQLDTQSEERRPATANPSRTAPLVAEARPAATGVVPSGAPAVEREAASKPGRDLSEHAAPAATAIAETKLPAVADAPATPVPAAPTAPQAVAEPVAPPAEKKSEAPAAVPPAPAPAAPAPVAPAPAAPAAPVYKDGTYLGWGTSRHGDIQASVVIEAGRIASATIAQCWTRYSCNVIAHLPPQVAQRQSPDVDFVSGATQSANAFYYGVVDALSKAK